MILFMAKEKQKKVGKDDEFISTVYRLLSMNQTGSVVNGHYMQIDGSNVKCDAASSSPAGTHMQYHVV